MKNISISVKKSSVLEDVSINSAYIGAKSETPARNYEVVATIAEDEELLTKYWMELCGLVIEKLQPLIETTALTSESLNLNLHLSNAYDEALTTSVEEDIRGAISAGVTAEWLAYTWSEKSKEWEEKSATLLTRAFAKLYHRRRPVRNS